MANLQLVILVACVVFFNRPASTALPPNNASLPDVCNNYTVISGGDRAQGSASQDIKCDHGGHVAGWYRFQGAAGDRIPDKCVPEKRCGTDAPGWMQGNHPTAAEGVVTRRVCYHFGRKCCRWFNNISVKNCSGYFVYKLKKTPVCNLRYCGNGGAATAASILSSSIKRSRPTTLPPRDAVVDECQSSDLKKCCKKVKCTKTPVSFNCTCLDGYFWNGTHWQDAVVDECQSSDLNKCHKKAKCTKTYVSFKCFCWDGYFWNGTHWQGAVVDECQSPDLNKCCKTELKCAKIPGSYKCTCLDGYFGNGTHCQG